MISACKIANAVSLLLLSYPCLMKIQQTGYRLKRGYFKIFASTYFALICFCQAVCVVLFFVRWQYCRVVESTVLLICGISQAFARYKTPLKFTKRIVRLYSVLAVACFCVATFPRFFAVILLPLYVALCFVALLPLEWAVNGYYFNKAKKRLARCKATKIAVCGSYGKTSVKSFLCQLLPRCVCSPKGFNTPLGLAKFVNRTDFDGYDYVIFEMGAKQLGDVSRLCKAVRPSVGILTGITEQHVETFGCLQNVVKAKCEIFDFIPKDGFCVVNGDDENVVNNLSDKCTTVVSKCNCLSASASGSTFLFDGRKMSIPLLGFSALQDVVLALTTAKNLGVEIKQDALDRLQPVEHRMQPIYANGVFIIDDSYNANIEGVRRAKQTLDCIDGFTKIGILQGIVECGKRAEEINVEVGRLLGSSLDVVIALGVNEAFILQGVGNCAVCERANSLSDAVLKAQKHYAEKTLLFFQNDIPDYF